MGEEVELIRDGEGLAVIGPSKAVESFLRSEGWLEPSAELRLDRLSSVLSIGSTVGEAAASISENTGRYLKLTKESAGRVKELGLMPTKTKGISHAMLGDPGSINKWIQIENGPGSLLANPALLSGVGGIMTQVARQYEAKDLKRVLVTIDRKLDKALRQQRNGVLAKLDRVASLIERGMSVRAHGGDPKTVWESVKAEVGTIAEVEGNALRGLEDLADEADDEHDVRALAKCAKKVESEVGVWIAVLARCLELRNEYAVLELDHVFGTAPSSLNGHRAGIDAVLQEQRDKIIAKTTQLLIRLDEAGAVAQENVLLHARAARSVVDSINAAGNAIEELHRPLSIESQREALTSIRRRDALRDRRQLRNAAAEAGPKVVGGALAVGVAVVGVLVKNNGSKDSTDQEELESH